MASMKLAFLRSPRWRAFFAVTAAVAAIGFAAGFAIGQREPLVGQTLPSPYYGPEDDVLYFAPGHKFKLQDEAEAQTLYRANQAAIHNARP